MVFPMALLKIAAHWLRSGSREAKKLKSYTQLLHRTSSFRSLQVLSLCPSVAKCSLEGRESPSIACDFQSTLLTTRSFFPFFMLLAFEGGGLLRALLLLLSYPIFLVLGHNHHVLSLRIMTFISFCGLRKKDVDLVARAVLPKFFLENLDARAYQVWASCKGKKVVVTGAPRVMVEWFLKDYLGANEVAGAEMKVVGAGAWCFFTGLIDGGLGVASKHKVIRDIFSEAKPDIGLVSFGNPHDHIFLSNCKQTYLVNKEKSDRATLPREKYPKPLIFHDGRLAFLPTPASVLALFLWLPFGLFLFFIRAAIGHLLPYKLAKVIVPLTGLRLRIDGLPLPTTHSNQKGVLYVCNHRTLLDPLFVGTAINRPLTAVTYSLSPISELLSPIKTARLSRDRKLDAAKITKLLNEGDLVVCPEGTTCREPYLLRFSALFAELSDNMVPVAIDTNVDMFYGTTASGFKFLDPVFFLMNPMPEYVLRFLGPVPAEMTCAAGRTAMEVANGIQKKLADALGFECTSLTRKDKYLMLAGNEGIVEQRKSRRS
ncbi:glycerol-3-phosphate acyltransferase 1 [Dendrobium catenatum]|uniref:Glycerol-3-phosphate acyltransferase 1 n=1 Tax=Dendrobium catenatum TaxID=906689 RepID=A0A2I0WFK7_9ASPA|nr:glycerol-3-phosphate acyltransferase 1 [Dendrobium catenatum]PKU74443.1 Glycerol-3-phosphate acyltransferase 1 [Dendrobium catenatum]